MMEPENSLFPGENTPEKKQPPALTENQSPERVYGSDCMVTEEVSMESDVTDQNSERVFRLLNKIEEKASSVRNVSLEFDCIDLMEEERLRVVEAKEKEIGLVEKSISEKLRVLEEKEMDFDLVQVSEASLMRFVFEKQIQEVVTKLDDEENEFRLFRHEKLSELDKAEKEQRDKIERWKEESKQLEARKKEVSSLEKGIKEKSAELKRKEETFELKMKEEAEKLREESGVKSRYLELMEKTLVKKFKELELKEMELEERSKQQLGEAETRKRSNLELEPPLLLKNGSSDAGSLTRLAKKHKSQEANDGDVEEIACIDKTVEDPKPLTCPETKFNDFRKSVSSFDVDQVWALHDPIDDMPRIYAQIRTVFSSQLSDLSLQVTLLEHVQATKDNKSILNACGRFEYIDTEIKSHLMFVHEMHYTKCGKDVIVNPREGETWALFKDWNISWNNHSHLHEPPYRYDFVEVISEFDDNLGITVAYMEKVDGFLSVFHRHGLIKIIRPEEMQRFSHKVASFKLSDEEKKGVPIGSFELDPAATLSYVHVLEEVVETKIQSKDFGKAPTVENEDGTTKSHPIIID